MIDHNNVLGTPLETCGISPMTGFGRDGSCKTGTDDTDLHGVCAVVTEEFLSFAMNHGNDLLTPQPEKGFPGLKPGDRWCLCVSRWKEAMVNNVAPPVILAATHASVLETVTRRVLLVYAIEDGHS